MFYNIINIIRTEPIGILEFRINKGDDTVSVVKTDTEDVLLTLPCDEFKTAADNLYNEIINANKSSLNYRTPKNF